MNAMASQITGVTIVYSIVCSGADQRKHQSSASLASVQGTHRWPLNSPHKRPVTRKMFSFMTSSWTTQPSNEHWWRCVLPYQGIAEHLECQGIGNPCQIMLVECDCILVVELSRRKGRVVANEEIWQIFPQPEMYYRKQLKVYGDGFVQCSDAEYPIHCWGFSMTKIIFRYTMFMGLFTSPLRDVSLHELSYQTMN